MILKDSFGWRRLGRMDMFKVWIQMDGR